MQEPLSEGMITKATQQEVLQRQSNHENRFRGLHHLQLPYLVEPPTRGSWTQSSGQKLPEDRMCGYRPCL